MRKLKLFVFTLITFLCFGVINVNAEAKEVIEIEGLTYTSRDYDNTPMVPTGTLTHTGYTGTIDVLYEGTDGTIYSSTEAPKNAGKYKVTYSIPSDNATYNGSKIYEFDIYKATPTYTIPTNLYGVEGNQLSTVKLPDDSGFWWATTGEIKKGMCFYSGGFTPSDTNNYESVYHLNIPVYGNSRFDIITSVSGGNGEISNSVFPAIEGTNHVVTFTPEIGYMIDMVTVNGEPVTVTSNSYNINNINESKNIVVTYKKIPYIITINSDSGFTVVPESPITVLHGENKEITITPNLGYKLSLVKVNNIQQTLPLTENKITLTNITEDIEIQISVKKIDYNVTEGDGQRHTIGKNENAVFKINADRNLFLKAYLNNEELNSEFYTITEGSTIISIKQDFLNNLLPGTYNLKATFSDDREANTTFVIAQPTEINPQTGDSIMLSIIFGSVSLISLLGVGLYTLKKRFN